MRELFCEIIGITLLRVLRNATEANEENTVEKLGHPDCSANQLTEEASDASLSTLRRGRESPAELLTKAGLDL